MELCWIITVVILVKFLLTEKFTTVMAGFSALIMDPIKLKQPWSIFFLIKKYIMKTIAFSLFLVVAGFFLKAQKLKDKYGCSIGEVRPNGTIKDRYGCSAGEIRSNGAVKDKYGCSAGEIRSNGTVKDKYGGSVGEVRSNGTVKDKYGCTIGEVRDDGTIKDKYGCTIGSAKGVNKSEAAYVYFFSKP